MSGDILRIGPSNRLEGSTIHSKSESRDSIDPAKKFDLSANLSKNATKWTKNPQK